MRQLILSATVLAILTLGFSGRAFAHPHGWIDLRSTLVLDNDGRLVAFEQEWLFDEFYSVFATDGWDMGSAAGKQALTDLARGNLENLRTYNYFTELLADGEQQSLGPVTEFETEFRNGRIWMRFVAPLETPLDMVSKNVSYQVFDPTYYIEILHAKGDVVAFRGGDAGQCKGILSAPTPTMEAVSLAQSLPPDAVPDESLGRLFAEKVDIECR